MAKPPPEINLTTSSEVADDAVPAHIFRLVVEQAALAISITDEQSNILYANPAFLRTTGYSKTEILGQNQSLLSYRVTPTLVYETMWAQIKRQRPWNGLLVNKRQDGSRYLADLTISPVVNEDGNTTHYLGMHRDVTEVHRLERQVQNQKSLIESVVDAAQVAIVLLDENERVLLDNQEYKKLIGDLGKEPAVQLLDSIRAQMGHAFEQAQNRHHNIAAREVCVELPKRAARWFSCAISWFEEQDVGADAFYEPQQKHYLLLTIADISELKRQQEALRINSLRALLSEQERIQGLRETLAGAVYQLEGPLNTLAAVTYMLERRLSTTPSSPLLTRSVWGEISATALETAIQKSREALETLRACIPNHIAEVSQPVNLNEILSDVLKLSTASLLAANIVVDWQPDVNSGETPGQPVQLSNLFKQLIANAVEAFYEQRSSHRELRILCVTRPDCIEVFIEDSGSGIADELRFKVFEPFFTTKGAEQQHLGLGLAMAQDVVTRHGGTIDIDPDYRNGCRVRVQLPRIAGGKHVS
ncbi:MAG: nitrogen fixation negative regulator NifL [Proteobacteria bacterium]|nr:nitrogen fixation negative regulator NifL [Pseudomonadota bacterium]